MEDGVNVHPVLRSAEAHLDFVRIHPYVDGNGRAARLVQDVFLRQRAYPSAIIPVSEREVYIGLLSNYFKTKLSPNDSESVAQARDLFFKYIASKVLYTAEDVEKEIKSKRMYEVSLEGFKDKQGLISIAKRLRKVGEDYNLRVGFSPKGSQKGRKLRVAGNISGDELGSCLKIMKLPCSRFDISPMQEC